MSIGSWWQGLSTPEKIAAGSVGLAALSVGIKAFGGSRFPVAGGYAFTVWTGGTLMQAWAAQKPTAMRIRPQILIAHVFDGGAGQIGAFARDARQALPGVRIWLQVAASEPSRGYTAPGLIATARQGVNDAGIEVCSFNDEYQAPESQRAANNARARSIVEGCRQALPGLILGHTSFSTPLTHMGEAWTGYLGNGGVDLTIPQYYPFGDSQRSTIAPGVLQSWVARFNASYAGAAAQGIIRPNIPMGVYLPSMYVPAGDLVAVGEQFPMQTFWPWNGRYDQAGEQAATALARR